MSTDKTTGAARHRKVLAAAIDAMRKDLIASINKATDDWAQSEGMGPKELTPQAVRDDKISNLVQQISSAVSEVHADALYSLVDAITGRSIPRMGGSFKSIPRGGAVVIGESICVITKAGDADKTAATMHVWNGVTGTLKHNDKRNVRFAKPEEVHAAIESIEQNVVINLYDTLNA